MQTRKVNTYGRRSIAIISAHAGVGRSLLSSPHALPTRSPSPDTPLSEISAGLMVLPSSPSLARSDTPSPPINARRKKSTLVDRSKKENTELDLSALSISSPAPTRRRKRQPILVPSPKVKGSPKQSRVSKKIRTSSNSPFRRIPAQRTSQVTRVPSKAQDSTIEISDDESHVSSKKPSPTRRPKHQAVQPKPIRTEAPRISESVIEISDDSIGPGPYPPLPDSPLIPPKRPISRPLSRQDATIGTPPLLRRGISGSRSSGGGISRLSFGATANIPPPLPPSPVLLSDDLPSPVDSDDEVAFLDVVAELESQPAPPVSVRTKSEPGPIAPPSFTSSRPPTKTPTISSSTSEPQVRKPAVSSSELKPTSASTKSRSLSSKPSILVVELPAPKKPSKPTSRRERPPPIQEVDANKPSKAKGQAKSAKTAGPKSPEKPALASISAPENVPVTKPNPSKSFTKPTVKARPRPQPTSSPYSRELLNLLEECSQSEPVDLGAFVATFSTDDVHFRFPSTSGPRRRWQKIGEASYSEVFRLGGVVVKIVPLKMEHNGWNGVDGPCVSEMPDVQKEIAITRAMGEIQEGFIKLVKAYVAFGSYPQELLNLWDSYDREFKSESIRPDSFLTTQLFVLLVLPDGGPDLEHYTFAPRTSWRAAAGIFWQVARTLARAESLVCFEHRDLHWGQILVQNVAQKGKTKSSKLQAHSDVMDSHEHSGVQVTLIDLGLSRMDTHTHRVWFTELEPEIFEGEGDYQFDVYRMMKAHCLGSEPEETTRWEDFRPLTNVMWLHYLARQLLRAKGLRKPDSITSRYHTVDDVEAEIRAFSCLVEVEKVLAASIVRAGGPAVSKAGGSILLKSAKYADKATSKLVAAQSVVRWGAEKRWIQPAWGSIDEARGI
ncbi:Serine/threonine-protein kinase haspin [Rhizoctonia solani]|uniref:non-specific serine/threonine protein kinase n=1 Tax=Rhizoctonia solani TaxID=456999 RepID=A0A0K6FPB9_9AGAM|nr:Serine/threonine-protein kinase haspin [Rhizoctonia solani]